MWERRFIFIFDNKSRTNLNLSGGRQVIQAVEKVMTFEWSWSQVLNQLMLRFEDRIEYWDEISALQRILVIPHVLCS